MGYSSICNSALDRKLSKQRKGYSSPVPWGRISGMRILLTALTCLILFTTPVVAEDCKRSYSENNIVIKSVASERRTFSNDAINLRAGPGVRYCLKRVLADGLSKSVEVIGQSGLWRQILLEGDTYWVFRTLLASKKN